MNSTARMIEVDDLGASAYLLMLGFKVMGKSGRSIVFKVEPNDVEEFNQKQLEYLSSEFHRFDSCLMSLKKVKENFN